jgi:hypothetical protein
MKFWKKEEEKLKKKLNRNRKKTKNILTLSHKKPRFFGVFLWD